MAVVDPARRQPPIGVSRQALLFSHFSNALYARLKLLNPFEQLPIACGWRTRPQPFLERFNPPDDAFHFSRSQHLLNFSALGVHPAEQAIVRLGEHLALVTAVRPLRCLQYSWRLIRLLEHVMVVLPFAGYRAKMTVSANPGLWRNTEVGLF
jgi:hypothetical protein